MSNDTGEVYYNDNCVGNVLLEREKNILYFLGRKALTCNQLSSLQNFLSIEEWKLTRINPQLELQL